MTNVNPIVAASLAPFAPRSHVTVVESPDGSMQEARLPAEDPAREDPAKRRKVLEAMIHDLQAQVDDIDHDELGATWHRAEAKALRTGRPEDKAIADAAWTTSIATAHLQFGHPVGEYRRDEVLAEMERLKAQRG